MQHGTHNAIPDDRNATILIYVDGDLVPRNEAKVSVFDSGFLVGDGIWDAVRLQDGVLVFLDDHLDRLFQGLRAIGLEAGVSRSELTDAIWRTVRANNMHTDVHVRFMITRGVKTTPSQDPRLVIGAPTVVIIAEHKRANPETAQRGIKLFTSTVRRGSPDYLDPRLNCHSKLHEVIALIQAIEAGADEALMLDIHGFVSTCNATNFFLVRGGQVWTSTGDYCLHGVTRDKVLLVARQAGLAVRQQNFSLTDVYNADEAFVTGTFGGLTPVVEVDGRVIGGGTGGDAGRPGPLTGRLCELYHQEIQRFVEQTRLQA